MTWSQSSHQWLNILLLYTCTLGSNLYIYIIIMIELENQIYVSLHYNVINVRYYFNSNPKTYRKWGNMFYVIKSNVSNFSN